MGIKRQYRTDWRGTALYLSLHVFYRAELTFITRHSLVRGRGTSFTVCFLIVFCQQFLDNPRVDSSQILHAGVLWFRMCLLPFWGLAAPAGGKGGNEEWRVCVSSTDAPVSLFFILCNTFRKDRWTHLSPKRSTKCMPSVLRKIRPVFSVSFPY